MCGIAGYLGDFLPERLTEMVRRIAHRGPDGEGTWHHTADHIGLGHRRLAIIDLSDNAKQPMPCVNGRYMVTFNGEIYNFASLAADLRSRGYELNERSDTAVLAPLYDCYGPDMLKKLSGIFAFAIWDTQEKELFVARDHLGIKPLYYSANQKGLLFASELKALVGEGVDLSVNENALFSYLTYLWSPGEDTLLNGVKKLLPGHYLKMRGSHLSTHCWYTPPLPGIGAKGPIYNTKKKPEDLLNLLDEVIDEQLVSDVPVGTFLSGGVDSSAIAASIARDKRPMEAFCVAFEGDTMKQEGFGEDVAYARDVASNYNLHLHEVYVKSDMLKSLPEMVYHLDEPQADPAPLFVQHIARSAKERGIKVLMSGAGGDDIFSGYRRHQVTMAMEQFKRVPQGLQQLAASGLAQMCQWQPNLTRRLNKLRYILENDVDNALLKAFHYTTPTRLTGLLSNPMRAKFANKTADYLEQALQTSAGQHPLNRQLYMELHGFLPDHNLNYTDKLSMAEGVEVRVPFLDPRVLDFAADLPIHWKMKRGTAKYILKKSLETRLPKKLLYRSKAGFGAPIRQWMQGPAQDFVRSILESDTFKGRGFFDPAAVTQLIDDTVSGKEDGAYTLLTLMVIELWMEQMLGKDAPYIQNVA